MADTTGHQSALSLYIVLDGVATLACEAHDRALWDNKDTVFVVATSAPAAEAVSYLRHLPEENLPGNCKFEKIFALREPASGFFA
jgi:hypothetical protein